MRFFGLETMSFTVALMPASSFSVIRPASWSSSSARASLVASLGTATVAPSGRASRLLVLPGYRPNGS